MHKNTKLLPYQRREIFRRWCMGEKVVRLAREYKVSRETVYGTLQDAKIGIFVNRSSMNYRYRSVVYGFKKLARTEGVVRKRVLAREKRLSFAIVFVRPSANTA